MGDQNFMAYLRGRRQGFNPFSAGNKIYESTGNSPNGGGPTNDPLAYIDRDTEALVRRNAMLRRLKANAKGNYMSSDSLTPQQRNW